MQKRWLMLVLLGSLNAFGASRPEDEQVFECPRQQQEQDLNALRNEFQAFRRNQRDDHARLRSYVVRNQREQGEQNKRLNALSDQVRLMKRQINALFDEIK